LRDAVGPANPQVNVALSLPKGLKSLLTVRLRARNPVSGML